MENKVDLTKQFDSFQSNLGKYEKAVSELLGSKFGITSQEFLIKVSNAIRKNPELLRCNSQSLFGSILYFAEIGLPFNTPEGYGYISAEYVNGSYEAVPIIGYRGLIEIAYRNPKVKSIRIQAVYSEDFFEYEYGTSEFIKHRPNYVSQNNKKLIAVYAIAKIEGIDPMFVVVHKQQLDELKKLNKTNDQYKKFDVFNIMESKVAIKLLFKTLPKTDNETLLKILDLDNKFDYDKNLKISASENGYELVEIENNTQALKDVEAGPIDLLDSFSKEDLEIKYESVPEKPVINIDLTRPLLTREEIQGTIQEKVTVESKVDKIEFIENKEDLEIKKEASVDKGYDDKFYIFEGTKMVEINPENLFEKTVVIDNEKEITQLDEIVVLVTDKALEEDKLTRPEAEATNEEFQNKKKELESFFDFSLMNLHENEVITPVDVDFEVQKKVPIVQIVEPIEKLEKISRWHPEFLSKCKKIEIPEIQELKNAQKLTPKTQKELLESIVEVIEPIDLTLN
jgi:recombination protein RecT